MSEVKFRSSCDSCLSTKVKCSQTRPACARCTQHGRQCVYSQYRKIGRPSAKALGTLTVPRGQLQEGAGKPGRRLKKSQQQHSPQLPVEHSPKGTEPLLPPNVLSESLGSSVNPSHLLNDFGTPALGTGASSVLEELHAGDNSASSAGDSALSLDQNMSDSGIGASLANSLEYGIGEVDWATLQGIIEGSASQELDLALQGQYYGPIEPRFWDSRLSPVCLDPGPTAQMERLYSPLTSNYSLFAGHPNVDSPGRPTSASRPSPSLFGDSNPFPLGTRCTSHCHGGLSSQLTKISEIQALGTSVALDVLLNLDNQVSRARDKILRCQSCLAGTGCAQTLLLLTLVVANVLSLFENSCGGSPQDGQSEVDRGSIPSADSPMSMSRGSSSDASDSRNVLPYTTRPLVLGTVQLNESVKRAFSRHLLRMYLDRQRAVVGQLEQLLRQTEGSNTSFKVTEDLLQDVLGRVERFIGFMTLTAMEPQV
ncbi:hypothetical protein Asppvi_001612 [Aspergillus pseudoviridinutans]|uniref:Zn(2)-C6 fungal-type domain-containing protein n=1 Tax=Aspergillus pseudoviridinutans TaxID=1517512 RepID=A0A9P3EPW1_9EURO|nr:uncharacterized protein Asppvi_001612 [Aspergillus pseudoviridinutans]GIJ83094.1 hypothetical protein Asppvi_001612 [Aspergillus pseudoviridinutans]